MTLITYFVIMFFLFGGIEGLIDCNGKRYYWATRDRFICCGHRLLFKVRKHVTCCGTKTYNPTSQMCCGGKINRRQDVNAGCCNGKPFQRGKQLCCGSNVIEIKTQGCCRNVPFDKGFEACCKGVKTANVDFDTNKNPVCCGSEIFNPRVKVCCAEKLATNVAGIFTRCCKTKSYDVRKQYCCNKVLPRRTRSKQYGKVCCVGEMIDAKKFICCGYGPKRRIPGEDNGCCQVGMYEYVLYDKNTHICCGMRVLRKMRYPAVSSCCVRNVYDVKTQLCCNEKIFARKKNVDERCCYNGPYDRNKQVCCHKTLHALSAGGRRYTFCCGSLGYDRREYECRYIAGSGYRLFTLNNPPPSKAN